MGGKVIEKAKKLKEKHRKGLWSPEEDLRLRDYILKCGHGCWSSVPDNAGLHRNGKSCRLRWMTYLRPGLKRGTFTVHEEETILSLHRTLGNKWSQIAQHLPGRTDNDIKNYWHSYLKRKVTGPEAEELHAKSECNSDVTDSSSFQELRHEFSCNPGKPTDITSLPRNILFSEWLTLNDNDDENAPEGSFSHYYHSYEDNNLIRIICPASIDCKPNLLQTSLLENIALGDTDKGAFRSEEMIILEDSLLQNAALGDINNGAFWGKDMISLQDNLLQNVVLGDIVNGNFGEEEMISGSY